MKLAVKNVILAARLDIFQEIATETRIKGLRKALRRSRLVMNAERKIKIILQSTAKKRNMLVELKIVLAL